MARLFRPADPLFAAPGDGNLSLQQTSPAVDTGTLLNAPDFDFERNPRPRGAGPDMGAIESF